jgi:hypothetical protein
MGKDSKLAPSEVVDKAIAFFGPPGAGLNVVEWDAGSARFEGTGGYVFVQTTGSDEQEGSTTTVQGRGWEQQIRQFMGEL